MEKRYKRFEKRFLLGLAIFFAVWLITAMVTAIFCAKAYNEIIREEATAEELKAQVAVLNQQIQEMEAQLQAIPSITVLSPNGGEEWVFGIPQTITWSSVGIDNVVIYLWFPDGGTGLLTNNVPASQGKCTLTLHENQQFPNIPGNITAGQYKISIWSMEPAMDIAAPHDYSDGYFRIVETK